MSVQEQDPLDPHNDIFWEGPEAIRKNISKNPETITVEDPPNIEEPYRLKPPSPPPAPAAPSSDPAPNSNTTLKRAAGPCKPNTPVHKEPELSEPDAKRLRETATAFGFGQEVLANQIKVNEATEGFRKLYVGALGPNTTERSLEQYFNQYGKVAYCQVIRERDTGMTKGFGFVTMQEPAMCQKILAQSVHVVDTRTIRVSLTHSTKTYEWKPPNPRRHEEKIELIHEVGKIEVREGRVYVGPLPDNVSPNILASHFSQYGVVASSNVSRAVHNTMKKNFGVVCFSETMPVKRVLQNPRHYINEQYVDITLSKFAMETFLSPTTLWLWEVAWSVTKEDITRYFTQFGAVFRSMHILNPMTGEKKGYGFVDFVDPGNVRKACHGSQNQKFFEVKGQRGCYGKNLPKNLKRDLMYMEDRFGNLLLRQLYQRVPDSGTWGGGGDHQESLKQQGAKTTTCKLPKSMLNVVVGEDGKIVADIARDSKTKISLIKSAPQEDTCLFHIVGSPENCKTAQYMMQIKIKEKLAKGNQGRYNR